MKKNSVFLLFILINFKIVAQISTNFDFENWTNSGSYEQPSNGWTTLNPIYDLTSFAPITVTKTTDKYSGTYAAKLESGKIFGVGTFIGGLLATGYFDNSALPGQNVKLGVPYNQSPRYINGYYKYLPNGGDSADIFCSLTKWNSSTNSRDTLGWVGYRELNTVSNYTKFSFKINYIDSITTPDSIAILFSSSAGAQNFQGQEGSTMFIDEISLTNVAGVKELISNEINIITYPNPTADFVTLITDHDKKYTTEIFSPNGKIIHKGDLYKQQLIDARDWENGMYYLSVKDEKGLVSSKRIIICK